MKKVLLLLVLFFVGCASNRTNYYMKTSVSPDSNLKVAVINENADTWWVSSVAYRVLITELMHVGFKVIERTNLEHIIKEQKLTNTIGRSLKETEDSNESTEMYITSTLDKNTIKEIGSMLGVDKLIVTYVVPNRGHKVTFCTIRLIDVYSGEVLTSTTIYSPMEGTSVDIIMKQAAYDIMQSYKTGKNIIRNKLGISTNSSQAGIVVDEEKIFRKKIDN